MRPWMARLALRLFIASAIGIVDRQRPFAPAFQATPFLQRRWLGNFGRSQSQFPLWRSLVVFHRLTRAMNDEHTLVAGTGDDLIHPGRHLRYPRGGTLAPVPATKVCSSFIAR